MWRRRRARVSLGMFCDLRELPAASSTKPRLSPPALRETAVRRPVELRPSSPGHRARVQLAPSRYAFRSRSRSICSTAPSTVHCPPPSSGAAEGQAISTPSSTAGRSRFSDSWGSSAGFCWRIGLPAYAICSRMPAHSGTTTSCARRAWAADAVVVHPQIAQDKSGMATTGIPLVRLAQTRTARAVEWRTVYVRKVSCVMPRGELRALTVPPGAWTNCAGWPATSAWRVSFSIAMARVRVTPQPFDRPLPEIARSPRRVRKSTAPPIGEARRRLPLAMVRKRLS
jgi:hypothetical protein